MKQVPAWRFHSLQALFWCANCTLTTYAVAYFMHLGIDSSAISRLLALSMVTAFVSQLVWGRVCDHGSRNKEVFILCSAISLEITVLLCQGLQQGNTQWMYLYPILVFMNGSLATNLDAWESKGLKNNGASLGISRGCAAAAYASFHFFFAKIVESTEYQAIPWFSAVLYGLTLLAAVFMPSVKIAQAPTCKCNQPESLNLKKLLQNSSYFPLLILALLIGMGSTPITNMKIVFYQYVGQDVSFLGVDSLCCSGFQIPLFFLSGALHGIPARRRLFFSTTLLLVAIVLIGAAQTPLAMVVGQVLLASAYPFLLVAMREMVADTVSLSMQTTANGLCDAVYGSMAGVLSLSYTGFVLDHWSPRALAPISMIMLSGAVLVYMGIYGLRIKQEKKAQKEG